MLSTIRFTRLLLLVALLISVASRQLPATGIQQAFDSTQLSYVVIGAFAYHKNAIRFVKFAKSKALSAEYALNKNRDLYYVYASASPTYNEARPKFEKIQEMTDFKDVWIFTGFLEGTEIEVATPRVVDTEEEEVAPQKELTASLVSNEQNNPAVEDKAEGSIIEPEENYHYLYLNAINAKNLKEVNGKVKVIDLERLKEIGTVKTHSVEKVKDPNNGTGRIKLATAIFGFREVQHVIDLDQPVNDTTADFAEVIGDSIIVDFELHRFRKGDVLIMYNVYFFIDAAIMKPESVYELNELLLMLQENENFKVRINGHTNGNSRGKIIKLNSKAKNYFSLNADHIETSGSAKKLSLNRAATIQSWLVDQGISKDRMKIKGWGGRRMLYGKHDPQAKKNVRVEIEITED